MIIITGAAGFIGSVMARFLTEKGLTEQVWVDDFSRPDKNLNLQHQTQEARVERKQFFNWLKGREAQVDFVIHFGARTDTAETDPNIFNELNLHFSQQIWQVCTEHQIPLIYASSAATYGDGSLGFNDDHAGIPALQALNQYGWSKQKFDLWVLEQPKAPPYWSGLKFFNVYGPNEYHKGRMASVIWHCFQQIQARGEMRLFRSHRADYADGEQLRDFIYVKDLCEVVWFMMEKRSDSGIYNLGSGQARSFNDLTTAVFQSLGRQTQISYIDTPADIRDKYQYFTEANLSKLRSLGYQKDFHTLEQGVSEYIRKYLTLGRYY